MSLAVRAFARNLTDRLIRDGATIGSLETSETLWLIRTSSIHLLPRQFAIAEKVSRNRRFSPEEAKHMAKCILEALSDAGLQISVAQEPRKP
jgi:hypothetical protein